MKNSLLLMFLLGCGAQQMKLDPATKYPKDMRVSINGHKSKGTLVVPQSGQYKVSIKTAGDVDLLWYSTCHRSDYQEKTHGWFDRSNEAEFSFRPNELERTNCAMKITGMEKVKGRHSFALVDFEDREHTLPARVQCNGSGYNSRGVTVCQSQEGLIQKISFESEVKAGSKCLELQSNDKMSYRFIMPKGDCIAVFYDSKNKKVHRLTTYGWTEPVLRKD